MLFLGNFTVSGFIAIALALLVGMTVHEYMHNYVAWLMGDNTPAYQGRLTLDPRKHIYWPGWLMWVIIGFGILGVAPINPNGMRNPRVAWAQKLDIRQRFGVSTLAGPAGSFLVAVIAAILFRLVDLLVPTLLLATPNADIIPSIGYILYMAVFYNVMLGFFNLIPLGGLDGRYILGMFIPPKNYYQYETFQNQYGNMVLMGLIMISIVSPSLSFFGTLIGGPTNALVSLLLG